MADRFFCRECGEAVIWGERKHRWTHERVEDDHAITLAKASEQPVEDMSTIYEPLEELNNIGTTGSLDGRTSVRFANARWVSLRIMIDAVWELTGGKPCPIG